MTYEVSNEQKAAINKIALENKINLNFYAEGFVSMSIGETENEATIKALIAVFEKALGKQTGSNSGVQGIPADLVRRSAYLTHEIFNKYRSESDMMRYIKRLENKDLSLTHSMISLHLYYEIKCCIRVNSSRMVRLGKYSSICSIRSSSGLPRDAEKIRR